MVGGYRWSAGGTGGCKEKGGGARLQPLGQARPGRSADEARWVATTTPSSAAAAAGAAQLPHPSSPSLFWETAHLLQQSIHGALVPEVIFPTRVAVQQLAPVVRGSTVKSRGRGGATWPSITPQAKYLDPAESAHQSSHSGLMLDAASPRRDSNLACPSRKTAGLAEGE